MVGRGRSLPRGRSGDGGGGDDGTTKTKNTNNQRRGVLRCQHYYQAEASSSSWSSLHHQTNSTAGATSEEDEDSGSVDEVFCLSSTKVSSFSSSTQSSSSSVLVRIELEDNGHGCEDYSSSTAKLLAPRRTPIILSRAAKCVVDPLRERCAEFKENLRDIMWDVTTRRLRTLLSCVSVLFALVFVILVSYAAARASNKASNSHGKQLRTTFMGEDSTEMKSMAAMAFGGGGATIAVAGPTVVSSSSPAAFATSAPTVNPQTPMPTMEVSSDRGPSKADKPSVVVRPPSPPLTDPPARPSTRRPSAAPATTSSTTAAPPTRTRTTTIPDLYEVDEVAGAGATTTTKTTTIRMNAGADLSFVDAFGQRWKPDRSFQVADEDGITVSDDDDRVDRSDVCENTTVMNSRGAVDDDSADGSIHDIDPRIFCHCALANGAYNFVVAPNAIYRADLYLVVASSSPSSYHNNETVGSFDVRAENMLVHRQQQWSQDEEEGEEETAVVTTKANREGYQVVSFYIHVADRQLTIEFLNGVALLAGIVVTSQPNAATLLDLVIHSDLTYIPGLLKTTKEASSLGLILSAGLSARLLARSGKPVEYRSDDGTNNTSDLPFHRHPDAGATFPTDDGGWIYVSNSEAQPPQPDSGDNDPFPGGVGALTFDRDGHIVHYQTVLNGTRANCGGGRTPWGTWISGEDYAPDGRVWQVDPTGRRRSERTTMGDVYTGLFESFAYDVRTVETPRFFVTQDDDAGVLRRFTPSHPDWSDPWTILHCDGFLDFLVVRPTFTGANRGTFAWTANHTLGAHNALQNFPHSERIDVQGGFLSFISKTFKTMFVLDLDTMAYVNHTTTSNNGRFREQPDQIVRMHDCADEPTTATVSSGTTTTITVSQKQPERNVPSLDNANATLTYFTADGGRRVGVHATIRTTPGGGGSDWQQQHDENEWTTILYSEREEYGESTGLSFSPNGKFMYVAYQDSGLLYEITRTDGHPFHAKTLTGGAVPLYQRKRRQQHQQEQHDPVP